MKELNLFERMPTSQSENVATAALAYLLNKETNEAVQIKQLFKIPKTEIIRELALEHSFSNERRIDLIIDTDKCKYGIEVKLGALFSDNQLKDYDKKLKELAERENKKYKLIALVPEWLKNQVKDSYKNLKLEWITWDDMIKVFNDDNEVSKNLKKYISDRLSELGHLETICDENSINNDQIKFFDAFLLHFFSAGEVRYSNRGGNLGKSTDYPKYLGCYIQNNLGDSPMKDGNIGYLCLQELDNKVQMVLLVHEELVSAANSKPFFKNYSIDRPPEWKKYEKENLGDNYKTFVVDPPNGDWKQVGKELVELFSKLENYQSDNE